MSQHGKIFMNKLSKQSNLKLTKSNSTKNFFSLHSLIVRKLNQKEKSSNIISKEINEYMNLPEKFFSPNSRVTIGKKIKLKDMKSIGIEIIQKKIPIPNKRTSLLRKSFNFNNNNINISNNNNNNDNLSRSYLPYGHASNKEKQQQSSNEKYEIIDNEQLKKIFNKYKTFHISFSNDKKNKYKKIKEKNNNKKNNIKINISEKSNIIDNKKIRNNNSRNIEMPNDIVEYLTFQNNKIKIRQKYDNKFKHISKYISKLINKKENDLLINRIDDYSFKKELLNEIDFNKPPEDKYGIYKWNISLRRPENFEGMRNSYINLTRDQNPFWGIVVEKYPKIKELKLRPGILNKNKIFLEKFKKAHLPLINYKDYKNLENLDSLSVKGKNLFNVEYNREINNNKGKKKLHKTFVDKGGRVILKTEINNIFGDLTFCENYNNNLLSTNRTNFTSTNSFYNTFRGKLPLENNYNKSKVSFKDLPNSSMFNDEILKKNTFFKSKSSVEI